MGIYRRLSAFSCLFLIFFFLHVLWSRARPRPLNPETETRPKPLRDETETETETHKIRSRNLHHWLVWFRIPFYDSDTSLQLSCYNTHSISVINPILALKNLQLWMIKFTRSWGLTLTPDPEKPIWCEIGCEIMWWLPGFRSDTKPMTRQAKPPCVAARPAFWCA